MQAGAVVVAGVAGADAGAAAGGNAGASGAGEGGFAGLLNTGGSDGSNTTGSSLVLGGAMSGLVGLPLEVPVAEVDPSLLAGGELFPDVTAIMPETSPSVQPASDTNLLANSQSIGLLSLAAQMEKTMAALQNQNPSAQKPTNTLALLAGPQSPVITDTVSEEGNLFGVTPLVNVKTVTQQTLPTDSQNALNADIPATNADAIIAAVKQVAKPAGENAQLQLKIVAEEIVDPKQVLQDMAQPGAVSKTLQKLLDKGTDKQGKSNDELLASLQQLIHGRAAKEGMPVTAALGQASQSLISADLNMDLGSDEFGFQSGQQNGSAQLMQATDHLRQTNHSESSFSRMLQQTTHYTPVADQVLVHIKTAISDGNSLIKIQLEPAELGRVDVRMDVGIDGKTIMMITADNKDTLEMLQREARNLENALRDLGLKTDAGGLSFQLRNQDQQQQKFTRTGTGYASVEEVEEAPVQPVTHSYSLGVQEGVDIRV